MVECCESMSSGNGDVSFSCGAKRPREPLDARLAPCWDLQRRLEFLAQQVDEIALELFRVRKRAMPPLPPLLALPESTRSELATSKKARFSELVTVQCKKILGGITAHKWCWPFLTPVDQAIYTDYAEKVPKPMDFGTVKTKLEAGEYLHPDAFVSDVRLVFANAKAYNAPGSDVHVMAETLLERFDERYVAYVVPKIADAEAASRGAEEAALRALVQDSRREAAAAAEERALLDRLRELRVELADAKSQAAAATAPMTRREKEALCDALATLPQPAFEAALALALHCCPDAQVREDAGLGLDLDRMDALALRQVDSFVRAVLEAEKEGRHPVWPFVGLGGFKLPPERPPPHDAPIPGSGASGPGKPGAGGGQREIPASDKPGPQGVEVNAGQERAPPSLLVETSRAAQDSPADAAKD